MFYFTCNESKIYESFTFWNKLQEKNQLFHDILIYWDAPVYIYIYTHGRHLTLKLGGAKKNQCATLQRIVSIQRSEE